MYIQRGLANVVPIQITYRILWEINMLKVHMHPLLVQFERFGAKETKPNTLMKPGLHHI